MVSVLSIASSLFRTERKYVVVPKYWRSNLKKFCTTILEISVYGTVTKKGGSRTSMIYSSEERGAAGPYTHVHGWCVGTKDMCSPAPLVLWGHTDWHFFFKNPWCFRVSGGQKRLKKA